MSLPNRYTKYNKVHKVKYVQGFKAQLTFYAYDENMNQQYIDPKQFFTRKTSEAMFEDADTGKKYHIPRSLVVNARRVIRGDNGQVISESVRKYLLNK